MHAKENHGIQIRSGYAWLFLFIEIQLIIFYAIFVEWGPNSDYANSSTNNASTNENLQTYYPIFQDVHVMMFIGFGFLMTYLRHHSWTSVGVNFLVTVLAIQLYFLFAGFWKRIFGSESWEERIHINTTMMIQADFAAASVLITFGGVLGKLSAYQMTLLTIIEVFFYAFNEELNFYSVQVFDVGGSMTIHAFGAYFGLACTWFISKKLAKDHPKNASNYNSNLFGMIGTLFLWMYWPSFNSALETGNGMLRTQICTLFSLIGSTLTTFMLSALYKGGKFHMEDILNATLAGGVMMGSSANVVQYPFAAFIVGCVAGLVSTFGFETLSGVLQRKIGLYDTAGIHNLHGMPGLLGGIVSAIFVAATTEKQLGMPVEQYFFGRSAYKQGGIQIACTFISVGIGLFGGIITGLLLKIDFLNPPKEYYDDHEFWEIDGEAPKDDSVIKIPNTHVQPDNVHVSERVNTDRIFMQTEENLIQMKDNKEKEKQINTEKFAKYE
eukprot:CAMPEP_0176425376 /NCGR_PEP_ID=MMETSP0127-20121128/11354_1 /TAXON_ID=938130 /ORGANISM="Platyophrya macrostoma, Strain WH" /LENGTH=495 /DNA_ID=CAMNT_0017806529 /DNA_START=24 /DNA_END=1511 /DNA_ORIENTATION=-